jgi:hypothetical protein
LNDETYSQDFDEEAQPEDDVSSASDDKTQPNYWQSNEHMENLPAHVKDAILKGKMKAKHSEFYYKIKELTTKIHVYRHIFDNRIPEY